MSVGDGEIKRVLGEADALLERLREEGGREAGSSADAGVEARYVLSPRFVGIVSLIVAIAALTALAIVAAVNEADGLATIALALAILAFVVQILVFIAQAQASSQQMLQSERLNTQTRGLLSEIQATSGSTQEMMREHVSELIRALIEVNRGKGVTPADMDALRGLVLSSAGDGAAARRGENVEAKLHELEQSLREMFLGGSYDAGTFPSEEEVEPVLDGLRSLSDTAKKRLRTFSADKQKIETGAEGGVVGFPPSESVVEEDQELLSAGFIQRVSVTGKDQAFFGGEPFIYRLTENGAVAGRVLNATGEVPEWAVPIIGSASEA